MYQAEGLKRDNYAGEEYDRSMDMVLVSNITSEPYFIPLIDKIFSEKQLKVHVCHIAYEEYDDPRNIKKLSAAQMVIVWLNFEVLFSDIMNKVIFNHRQLEDGIHDILMICRQLYKYISGKTHAPILWFSFEDYYNPLSVATGGTCLCSGFADRLNIKILDMLCEDVAFIDTKRLIAEVGKNNAYNRKGKYRWNSPYSKEFTEAAVREIHKQFMIIKGITKKCLVLDCDNVLWGGILSEDGIENIKLGSSGFGRIYQDFQRLLLSLFYHGVILTICSKNDLTDVLTVFRHHSEMIIKEEHIACFQVNWDNKPDNIKKIAGSLNIGIDSMVFVDDSPVEIEAVKAMLPEVTAILFDHKTVYEQLSCFNLKSSLNIDDVENRNETYHTNKLRESLKVQYENYDEYIAALDIRVNIHEAVPIEFNRISELTQRTNRCTNGKRYTVAQIKERAGSDKISLYSLSVSDRFSDLGLVGVLEVDGETLSLFSLSCRALGREIEKKMLAFIKQKHQIKKVEFYSTGKNDDIKMLLKSAFPGAVLE